MTTSLFAEPLPFISHHFFPSHPLMDKKRILCLHSIRTSPHFLAKLEQKNYEILYRKIRTFSQLRQELEILDPDYIIASFPQEEMIDRCIKQLPQLKRPLIILCSPKECKRNKKLRSLCLDKRKKVVYLNAKTTLQEKILSNELSTDDAILYFCKKKKYSLQDGIKQISISISKKKLFEQLDGCKGKIYLLMPDKQRVSHMYKRFLRILEKELKEYKKNHPEKELFLQTHEDISLEPWNYVYDQHLSLSLQKGKKLFKKEEKTWLFIKRC